MERSAESRHVGNYERLSYYYDELLQDEEALSLWLDEIEEAPFHSLLELASGSAVITGILERKGYDILASDISEAMKRAAERNYQGEYRILDMTDFHLVRKFDVVICIVDSVNYLDTDELKKCFRCVYDVLNEGGRFYFDMHHPKRLDEFSEEYIEEGSLSDCDYQWTIFSEEEEKLLHEHFVFYTDEGMFEEYHTQFVHDIDDVKAMMEETGFKTVIKEDFVKDEKILVKGVRI